MRAYSFNELSQRAQDAAYLRYSQAIDEAVNEIKELFPKDDPYIFLSVELSSLG